MTRTRHRSSGKKRRRESSNESAEELHRSSGKKRRRESSNESAEELHRSSGKKRRRESSNESAEELHRSSGKTRGLESSNESGEEVAQQEHTLEETINDLQLELVKQRNKLTRERIMRYIDQKRLMREHERETRRLVREARREVALNFQDALSPDFQCPVCLESFVHPEALTCGHTFCRECLNRWFETKKECPSCRSQVLSRIRNVSVDNLAGSYLNQVEKEANQRDTESTE